MINKDKAYLDRLKKSPEDLIFIMGPHRSGTSFFHKILTDTHHFNYLRAYDAVKYDEILFNYFKKREEQAIKDLEKLLEELPLERGFDHLPINVTGPVEYNSILRRIKKVDRISFNPLTLIDRILFKPILTPETIDKFTEMCKKLITISSCPNKPLLLKGPRDFYNFLEVHNFFPNAKYIFIHRHPLNVLHSNLTSWAKFFTNPHPFHLIIQRGSGKIFEPNWFMTIVRKRIVGYLFPKSKGVAKHFIYGLARGLQNYSESISKLDKTQYISIKYENLCRTPLDVINEVLNNFNLKETKHIQYHSNPRSLTYNPLVYHYYKKNISLFQTYLEMMNYPRFPDEFNK